MSAELSLPAGCEPRCPGCKHRSWEYAASIQQKADWLKRTLSPWAAQFSGIRQAAPEFQLGYRDKALLHCHWLQGSWQIGMRRGDDIIPIPDCPVHSPRVRKGLHILSGLLPGGENFKLAYLAFSGGQLTLVLKQASFPPIDWLSESAKHELQLIGFDGLWIHLHPSAGKKVFSKNGWHLLWGQETSTDQNGLLHGPAAFQQLIPSLANQALDQAEAFLQPNPASHLVDLYCGTGTSLRRWLAQGANCLGVESAGPAIELAAINAPGAELLRGSCQHRLPQIQQWLGRQTGTGLLYLNPPRTGLEAEVSAWILAYYQPARIAYLSCSAGTLARDLTLLEPLYEVIDITGYDFFPQTHHVETLVLLAHR